jgi:GNAT superfamily N-acetyltransferase
MTMSANSRAGKAGVTDNSRQGKNALLIRDVQPSELNDVSLLVREAYIEYQHSIPSRHWRLYLENITDVRSRLGVSELIVAELDKQLVGAVTLYLETSPSLREDWPEGWAGVRILAVRPPCRGRGIGRALMEECIRRCQERNIKTIGLHTGPAMAVAHKMYEDMGFVRAPEYDFQPAPGIAVMAYRLDL